MDISEFKFLEELTIEERKQETGENSNFPPGFVLVDWKESFCKGSESLRKLTITSYQFRYANFEYEFDDFLVNVDVESFPSLQRMDLRGTELGKMTSTCVEYLKDKLPRCETLTRCDSEHYSTDEDSALSGNEELPIYNEELEPPSSDTEDVYDNVDEGHASDPGTDDKLETWTDVELEEDTEDSWTDEASVPASYDGLEYQDYEDSHDDERSSTKSLSSDDEDVEAVADEHHSYWLNENLCPFDSTDDED